MNFRRHGPVRAAATAILLAALASTGVATSVLTARAGTSFSCLGTESIIYSPGLLLAVQQVSFAAQGTFGPCIGTDQGHASGTYAIEGSGELSCISGSSAFTGKIDWAGGAASSFAGTVAIGLRPAGEEVLVYQAAITSGDFEGETITSALVLANTVPEACVAPPGVTSDSGPVTLTFS